MPESRYVFPDDFLWGVATSSYQIEGAANEDGRGPSIWDTFSHTPGKVHGGETGDVACDHYHRYEEDVALMRELGVNAYRFSISWSRVLPEGRGRVNQAGLDFYGRLVDALLKADIKPCPTLFHWDLPQALEDEGGWRNRDTAYALADYAGIMVKALGDRVESWMTLNEMPCSALAGYEIGCHAPGAKENPEVVNQVVHHHLLAHGLALRAVREHAPGSVEVGGAHNPNAMIPLTESDEDIAAARKAWREDSARWMDPMLVGTYPESGKWSGPEYLPEVQEGDLAIISTPMDFLGLNLYWGQYVEHADNEKGYRIHEFPEDFPRTLLGSYYIPELCYWVPRFTAEEYGVKKMMITENGASFADVMTDDGRVVDLQRRKFIRENLVECQRATAEGYPLKGYFMWSFMDNFEWNHGYGPRFGMVHVDFETQERTIKESGRWYREASRRNAII